MPNRADSPFLLFDFPDDQGKPQNLRFADPIEVIVAERVEEVLSSLHTVQAAVDAGFYAAGYVAYEAAPGFDAAFCVRTGAQIPLAWFGIFAHAGASVRDDDAGAFHVSDWQPTRTRLQYDADIAAIREAIACGETYQVNYTLRLRAHFEGDDFAFCRRLCAAQQAAYGAYLHLGRYRILSASPELFFRWAANRITTRPMKGTAVRGRWSEEDAERSAALAASAKERAENLMIVDLLRNDLGRLADVGSVHVSDLFAVERYRTLLQMTSTITATLPPETTLANVFQALFPCGSVTGAPKISTMRIIAALEDSPRQVYCGAIGFIEPGGAAVFNVAIRTVLLDTQTGIAEYGIGGGITWDSTPEGEYAEALAKAAILCEESPHYDLLETLRLENGVYALLDRHLQRLRSSADYFAIPLSLTAVARVLEDHARAFPEGAWRVRLLVSQAGDVRLENQPLLPLPPSPLPVALAAEPVSRDDRFLFHKTTHRSVYDARRAQHSDVFDVLLWNEEGELTEFTVGNLVVECDGHHWTPPRSSGLLAGTFRAELLDRGEIEERILTRADLTTASAVWLINSVRGWVPVSLLSPA